MKDFPDDPAVDDVFENWKWDGVKWVAAGGSGGSGDGSGGGGSSAATTVALAFSFPEKPPAAGRTVVPVAFPLSFPAGLAGTVTDCAVAAAVDAVFSLTNRVGGEGATIDLGTITFVPATTDAVLAGAGGTVAAGDVLTLYTPTVQDAALQGLGISILADRLDGGSGGSGGGGSGGAGIPEAPVDTKQYGRQDADWTEIAADLPAPPPPPVMIAFTIVGLPPAGAVYNLPITTPLTIPANLAGTAAARAVAPTGQADFVLNKAGDPTPVGTVSFLPDGGITLAGAGATLAANDVLIFVAPAVQDATLSGVGVTFYAERA